MRLRSWFFLSLGLLLAILTGVALNGVAQQSAGPAAAAPTTVRVIVAKADAPARAVLTAAMLTRRDYPTDLVPNGVVGTEMEAVGPTTLAAVPSGAPLLPGPLLPPQGKKGPSPTRPS